MKHLGVCLSTPNNQKKSYGRPKSAEPGSPLLRRALSPDRLHPRSAENKTSISPLANTVVKVTPRATIAQSYSETPEECSDSFKEPNDSKVEKKVSTESKSDYSKISHGISINLGNVGISNSCGSTQLPRIAEEKDSPTGSKADDYSKEVLPLDKMDKNNTSMSKLTESENTGDRSDGVESKTERQNLCTKNLEVLSINKIEEGAQSDNCSNVQARSSQSTFHKQSQNIEKGSQASSQKTSSQNSEKGSQSSCQKILLQASEKSLQSSAQKILSQANERGFMQGVSQKSSQNNEKVSLAAVQKLLQGNEKTSVPHKVTEQKAAGKNSEANLEGRKISKKYKIDSSDGSSNTSSTQHSNTFEAMGTGKDKKNN